MQTSSVSTFTTIFVTSSRTTVEEEWENDGGLAVKDGGLGLCPQKNSYELHPLECQKTPF